MPTELIEHLLTPEDTLVQTSSGKLGFSKFVDLFNEYGAQHFDISPKSRPIFFYHMFLASTAFLPRVELTQKFLTEELHYKNDMENRVLKVAYRRDETDTGRLVLRVLDFSNDEASNCHFTNDEINELLQTLKIPRDENTVDYKKVVIEQTGEAFLKEASTAERMKEYHSSVIVKAFYEQTFSSIKGRVHNLNTPNPIVFSLLSSPDLNKVLRAAGDIFTELKNSYTSQPDSLKANKLTMQRQAGFMTGILTLNLKSRNMIQVHVATKVDSILLHVISDIKLSQKPSFNVPVIFDIRSISDPVALQRIRNTITLLGVHVHPALETDSETSAYMLTDLFDSPTTAEHIFPARNNKYEGIVKKITDYYDGCPEEMCLDNEELMDLQNELTMEMEYSMNVLNSRSKVMMDRFVMGQIMSFDMPQMERYKYQYLHETEDCASTYALYVENGKKQIVINVMRERNPDYETPSTPRLVPHHHDQMTYESLVVDLIVEPNKQKTRATAKYQVVDLKPWHALYHQVPNRGISLKQFLVENGVIYSGLAKSVLSYNFNEVLYNDASVLLEKPKYMEGVVAHLHSQYKSYFKNEQEFVAFCKGAALEKFDLVMSLKKQLDILALKRRSKKWYSYNHRRHFSDEAQSTILIKVAKIDPSNGDIVANTMLSKTTELYSSVQEELQKSSEMPLAFAMAFTEDKTVIKPLKYQSIIGSEVVTEKLDSLCLSRRSRRKRESMGQCFFDWEDVDQFNTAERGDIKIDEKKFLEYLTKVESQNKKVQLLAFVEQKMKIHSPKLRTLIRQSQVIKRISGLSRTSHLVMRSFMLKDIVSDLLTGNLEGVAANVGFIGGSYLMMKASDSMKTRALKLNIANKATFRGAVKAVAPFVSRLTSAYNIYHLYKSIQALKNGSSEALVSVVNDGTFVLLDTVEIGAELLETFGVVEGLTSIVFPVGTALAAVAMIGTEIYSAYKSFTALKQINQEIHLTTSEWLVEGFRSLLGMGSHYYLPKLFQAKKLNQHLVDTKSLLLNEPGVDHVVFATEEVCRSMESHCDNTLIVLESTVITHWNRAKPSTIENVSLSCYSESVLNSITYQKQLQSIIGKSKGLPNFFRSGAQEDGIYTTQKGYFCQNAIGLSRKGAKSGAAYIEIGNGFDYVIGMKNNSNIVTMGSGEKYVTTGDKSDSFITYGDTRGVFNGSSGQDFLDLQWFTPKTEEMIIVISDHKTLVENETKEPLLIAYSVFDVIMRHNKPDLLICQACQTKYIESGNILEDSYDRIWIGFNNNCTQNLQVVLNGNVKLKNRASEGIFYYKVQNSNVNVTLKFSKRKRAKHIIMLNFELNMVESIRKIKRLVVLKTYDGLMLSFGFLHRRVSLIFSDRVVVKVRKFKMFAAFECGSIAHAMQYIEDAERLKIIFTIWLTNSNETVLIGHSLEHANANLTNVIHHSANIIRNNPIYNCHLIGGNGEHVYVINFPLDGATSISNLYLHNITIYYYKDIEYWNMTDTIDIHDFTVDLENRFHIQTKLNITRNSNDIVLTLMGRDRKDSYSLFSVILKSAFDLEWYKKIIIIHHRPMNISYIDRNHSRSQSHAAEYYQNGIGATTKRKDVELYPKDCCDLQLLPFELIFGSNLSTIIIQENDIEPKTIIKVEQSISGFELVQHETNLLIIAYKDSIDIDLATVIILKNYFSNYLSNLHTVNLEFENWDIDLMREMELEGFLTLDHLVSTEEEQLTRIINE